MSPEVEDLRLLVSHQDQLAQLPENRTLLARSEFYSIAAYRIGDQLLCSQAHPEFVHSFAYALLEMRQPLLRRTAYCSATRGTPWLSE